MIGLARAAEGEENMVTKDTDKLVIEGLFTTVTNVNFSDETVTALIEKVHDEKSRIGGGAVCDDYDMDLVWNGDEDISFA